MIEWEISKSRRKAKLQDKTTLQDSIKEEDLASAASYLFNWLLLYSLHYRNFSRDNLCKCSDMSRGQTDV